MARSPTLRSIAATAVAAAWFAIVAGSGGCELAIGSSVPGYACVPGHDSCPNGQLCNAMTNHCESACSVSTCNGTCDPTSGICVQTDSGVIETSPGDTTTPPESAADTMMQPDTFVVVDTGTPETVGPCRTTGCPCSGAASCDSQICADSLTVTSALNAIAGNFCTKPCCTSADCDAGTVCFATGQGGDYCVQPAWLMRDTATGAAAAGATCATGRDCRSALCDTASSTCVDTCCSSGSASQCTAGEVCQFGKFAGAATLDQNYSASCAQGGGSGQDGSSCSSDSSCKARLCAQDGVGNLCHGVCRSTADCGSGESCEYVLPTQPGTPPPVVAACFSSVGSLAEGAVCNPMNDMCTGFCDPTAKVCTDVCFADADCMSGWRCRPEMVSPQGGGSYSVLACGT